MSTKKASKPSIKDMEDKQLKATKQSNPEIEKKHEGDCGCRTVGGRKIIIRKPI